MKTIQPKDFSEELDEHLKASRMGESEQRMYLRNAVARLVVFGFALWLAAWGLMGWWNTFFEVAK